MGLRDTLLPVLGTDAAPAAWSRGGIGGWSRPRRRALSDQTGRTCSWPAANPIRRNLKSRPNNADTLGFPFNAS